MLHQIINKCEDYPIEDGFVKKSSVKNVKALNRLIFEVFGEKRGKQ